MESFTSESRPVSESWRDSGNGFPSIRPNRGYEDLWYYGHVEETELEWLQRELSHVPAI
jgi:hypothetical protein